MIYCKLFVIYNFLLHILLPFFTTQMPIWDFIEFIFTVAFYEYLREKQIGKHLSLRMKIADLWSKYVRKVVAGVRMREAAVRDKVGSQSVQKCPLVYINKRTPSFPSISFASPWISCWWRMTHLVLTSLVPVLL